MENRSKIFLKAIINKNLKNNINEVSNHNQKLHHYNRHHKKEN